MIFKVSSFLALVLALSSSSLGAIPTFKNQAKKITYLPDGTKNGKCGFTYDTTNDFIVAVSPKQLVNADSASLTSPRCGFNMTINILLNSGGGAVEIPNVMVGDSCDDCNGNDIKISSAAGRALLGEGTTFKGSWEMLRVTK